MQDTGFIVSHFNSVAYQKKLMRYSGVKLLCKIREYIFDPHHYEHEIGDNVDEEIFRKIKILLKEIETLDLDNMDLIAASAIITHNLSLILFYQLFIDGNKRTLISYLQIVLRKKGYNYHFLQPDGSYDYRIFFETFKTENDHVSSEVVYFLHEYLFKLYKAKKGHARIRV